MINLDMVLINGRIFSVDMVGDVITGESVAVDDGVIMAVGSNEDLKKYIGPDTTVIDCGGKSILPGLCDAHCHPSIAAGVEAGCDLFGIYIGEGETPEEVISLYLERLRKFVEGHPQNEIIRGTGWVFGNFSEGTFPTRHDLDKICNDRPVILESFCQHNLWVNTKAIEVAGVDENTPDTYMGRIHREDNGYPSGIFHDIEAINLIKNNVHGYDLSIDEYKKGLLTYQRKYANRYGVTLIQDCMHSDNAREAYRELAEEGKLTIRARGVYLLEPDKRVKQLEGYIDRKGSDDVADDFGINTIKIFTEGLFSLLEPYEKKYGKANEPLYWNDDELTESSVKVMEAGFNLHIHAMGDKSVKQSIQCLSKAQVETGLEPRNTIAHLMLIKDEDVKMIADHNIIANCQPRWMVYDSDIASAVLMMGRKRADSCYPLRCFIDEGITVAFGTDFPVTPPPDTMHEIQCAMTRSVFPDAPDYESFKGQILGQEKPANLKEAVKALSINGAFQMNLEELTGSIEVGKSADMIILDSDIENTAPEDIYGIKVEKTIFKGEVVYNKEV